MVDNLPKWWSIDRFPKKKDKLVPLDAPLLLGVEEALNMNRYYNGDTDDFAIFKRGLSQDAIKKDQARNEGGCGYWTTGQTSGGLREVESDISTIRNPIEFWAVSRLDFIRLVIALFN